MAPKLAVLTAALALGGSLLAQPGGTGGAAPVEPAVLARSMAPAAAGQAAQPAATAARDLFVTVGKSLIVESPVTIQRVSIADPRLAEAVAVSPREVLVNGLVVGETSLVIWQQGGNRLLFDLTVRRSTTALDAVRREINTTLPGQNVQVSLENNTVFLRGTVNDLISAQRAVSIASTLGQTVNLLNVKVPPVEGQILLKVRFADVDRAASIDLGANLFSTGALNTPGSITTGTFSPPQVRLQQDRTDVTLADTLNVFLLRPDLNLGATIRALQGRRLLQILAEPNVLTINGKPASFLSGGEFPYPTLQGGGGGLGAVTIQFREFGVRINFLPNITPRGTIRLQVTPEVSSLDLANGLTFQGVTIPGLATRRVQTEIELEPGQSFAIGGLLDNRVVESWAKIPGLGDIPLFGKLFQSRNRSKNNTELVVLVTPELVRPLPTGQPLPDLKMPAPFLEGAPTTVPRHPGIEQTGPVPVKSVQETIPVEQLIESQKAAPATPSPQMTPIQLMPLPPWLQAPPAAPGTPAPAAPSPAPRPAAGAGAGQ